jgi:hypothetical protein
LRFGKLKRTLKVIPDIAALIRATGPSSSSRQTLSDMVHP